MARPNRTVNGLSSLILCPPDLPGSGSSTKCCTKPIKKQPLEGRARFESIFRVNSLNHVRLSWRAYLL
eukprot:2658521-Pleurochrysis_carterae.AAC.1